MPGVSFLGAASGLDLNGMISQLVQLERAPIQREQQKIDLYQYKQQTLQSIRSHLLGMKSTISQYTSTSLEPPVSAAVSDESVFTASTQSFAPPGTYLLQVNSLAKNHIMTGTQDLAALGLTDANDVLQNAGTMANFSFDINGVTVNVDATATGMAGLRNAIQTALSDPGATAGGTVLLLGSGTGQKLSISAEKAGTANAINIVDTDGQLALLGLVGGGTTVQAAQDTDFDLNGVNYTSDSTSVSTALSGVTFNFKTTGNSTLTIALDSNKVASDMEKLVSQFNNFQKALNSLLLEKRVANPQNFSEFATGAFAGDSDLQGMLTNIRQVLTNPVTNTLGNPAFNTTYSYGAAVGLDSTEFSGGVVSGDIQLNSATFSAAFADDPDGVMAFLSEFTTRLDATITRYSAVSVVPEDRGVLDALESYLKELVKGSNERIGTLEDRVAAYEARLRAQFTAMESAIQAMQLQSGAISGFLASGTQNNNSKK